MNYFHGIAHRAKCATPVECGHLPKMASLGDTRYRCGSRMRNIPSMVVYQSEQEMDQVSERMMVILLHVPRPSRKKQTVWDDGFVTQRPGQRSPR